jgi:hypothetical protein
MMPKTLNGYPILHREEHEDGTQTVMAFREWHPYHPFVVARWWVMLEHTWAGGQYLETLPEAMKAFEATAKMKRRKE